MRNCEAARKRARCHGFRRIPKERIFTFAEVGVLDAASGDLKIVVVGEDVALPDDIARQLDVGAPPAHVVVIHEQRPVAAGPAHGPVLAVVLDLPCARAGGDGRLVPVRVVGVRLVRGREEHATLMKPHSSCAKSESGLTDYHTSSRTNSSAPQPTVSYSCHRMN